MPEESDESSKGRPPAPLQPDLIASTSDEHASEAHRAHHSWRKLLLGKARSVEDPRIFHHLTLIAFLAWVGLGADGLSSSSYGPEEAFKALGQHTYLAVGLAIATALTVLIISLGYSRIIEQFPFGGGGYVVATRLLGSKAGVVSGSALLVDYVLTISISIAAGGDAVFSFLPAPWHVWKLPTVFAVILVLSLLNLRGVKESVALLTPIFVIFLLTHAVLIVGAFVSRADELPVLAGEIKTGYANGLATLGLAGMAALFLRAYSLGAGTYTGIEAVSNGLAIMREPKVLTGKRTMLLMATSLALTAAGITFGYLLLHVHPEPGRTMNAVLADRFAGTFVGFGLPLGQWFVVVTLAAEALLLFVAAQAGFIDGPRVMANMAADSWLPHRFVQLSERLTMMNGVMLMCGASLVALLYTGGHVGRLVVLYAINVFITFSLSQAAMCKFWWRDRARHEHWRRNLAIHAVGFLLCFSILSVTIYEKFGEGAWITVLVTSALVGFCFLIRAHYRRVFNNLSRLDEILPALPKGDATPRALDPKLPTAVLWVGAYAGLGVHQLLAVQRLFPGHFKNFVFASVAVIDSATFKDVHEVEVARERTDAALKQYVQLAHRLGLAADYRMAVGTEAVDKAEELARQINRDYPRALFFAGKLIFERERWFHRLLHNDRAYAIQRRLQFAGLNAMVLPVRVLQDSKTIPA